MGVGLAVALAAAEARAQGAATGTATATATVISPLGLSVTRQLDFGTLAAGTSKSMSTNGNGNAHGRFHVSGQGAHAVSVALALPGHLAKGGDQLVIDSWAGTSDTFDGNNMSPFTPASGVAVTRTLPGTAAQTDQRHYFRIVARVVATGLQPTGLYTGTIAITAAYTGI